MTDLLSVGLSGLRTYQTALGVVGENINNANTPGYSRRTTDIRDMSAVGGTSPLSRQISTGAGSDAVGVKRAYDNFLATDARMAAGDYQRASTRQTWLTQLQSFMTNGSQALGGQLTKFYNAAQDVATDPLSMPARDAFLDTAKSVANQFQNTSQAFVTTRDGIKGQAEQTVSRINQLAESLNTLNGTLRRTAPGTSQSAGLQDERDRLVDELGTLTKIDVKTRADGTIDIRLDNSNGPVLLDQDNAKILGVKVANNRLQLSLDPFGAGGAIPMPSSGSIAGLADAYAQTSNSLAEIDKLANDFAASVNAQHRQGADLAGNPGGDVFTTGALSATPSRTNNGKSTVQLEVTDYSQVQAQGYELRYDNSTSQWTLKRNDGSASVTGIGALDLDGMHIEVGGSPKDQDFFSIAGQSGAAGMQMVLNNPGKVAAAAPYSGSAKASNQGTATIAVRVNANAAAITPALPGYRVDVGAAGAYSIVNPADDSVLATGTIASGSWVAVNGFEYKITGSAAQGDSFTVGNTGAGMADNGNMVAIINTRLGNPGFEGSYTREVTRIATALSDTTALATAAKGLSDKAGAAASASSSVNLDEEASDLIRFQQAYQASARIISTARELFQTLLSMN